MRHALGVMGVLAAGVLLVVSAAMNYRFGLSLGKSELDGQIYGVASAAADCMKALVPFFFFAAIKNRAWSQAAASMVVWSVVTAYSLTSAFGHAALNRFDVAGQRAHEAQAYKDLRSDLARTKEQLSWIPQHRPGQAVAAEITNAKAKKQWRWTKGCTRIKGKYNTRFCEQYTGLVSELASAEQAEKLEVRVASLQSQLGGINGGTAMAAADPQAAVLSQLTGVKVADVQLAMTLFIALLLEVGSAFGLYVAFSQWRIYDGPTPPTSMRTSVSTAAAAVAVEDIAPQPVAIEKPRSGANDNKTAEKPVETVQPMRLVAPENDVERFYKQRIETQDGSSLTATALYEDYCAWCETQDKEPLAFPAFGRQFGDLGIQKAKIAGRVRYIGIALRTGKKATEDTKRLTFGSKAA
ncbi:MAG: hypothetical protein AAFV69_04115 [Pseudomonadota bacterium]